MRALLCSLSIAIACPAPGGATDDTGAWPQWLGPSRNGAAPAAAAFPRTGSVRLRTVWRRPVGVGTAGLAVSAGTVVTLESDGDKVSAIALSAADGSVLWRSPLDAGLPDEERGPGSAPAVHDGRVYAVSPACQLRALDLASGRVSWHVDLKTRFGAGPQLGCLSSPLLDGDRVILQPGSQEHQVVALDGRTGALAWSAKGVGRANYTSPGMQEKGGEWHVLIHHADVTAPQAPRGGVTAVRARDGQNLWHLTLDRFWSWATPVPFGRDDVLLLTWNDAAALRVSSDGATASVRWRSPAFTSYVSPPVFHEGHFYGFGGDFLRCLRAEDGATVWEERTYPGSLVLADGHLVALSVTAGLLRVVEATPAGYRERARLAALAPGARAETPPSVVGRRVFLRNDEEVIAVDVEGI